MIGRGPSARTLRLSLKPITVVGATTRAGRLSAPLRDRFGAVHRLDYYGEAELAEIVRRSAAILDVAIEPDAVQVLARRGRGTPRIVNRLLRRVRDHAEVRGDGRITREQAEIAMTAMDIDDMGLLGSAVLGDRVTELLDVRAAILAADPAFYTTSVAAPPTGAPTDLLEV